MGYLFAAYTIIWLLLGGYILTLGKRQRDLQKQIDMLEEWNKQ
ncbi:CcmD family protein [Brevibacillus sp. SYSU BS000544]